MNKSWFAAGAVVVVLGLWMASGLFESNAQETVKESKIDPLMTVEIQTIQLEPMTREISLQGQLEPAQHLLLKAETSGKIEQILVSKGERINKGDTLVRLDQGSRQNSLAEAAARVKSAHSEQAAAETLRQQRLQSKVQLEQTEAALESALAQLRTVELDINNTSIKAPFNAIINDLPFDHGALIERGDVIAELVDDSAFDVTAQAAQQTLANLKIGQAVSAKLITGETLPGTLTFISSIADSQTRSFRVEARVDNPHGTTAAGVSTTLSVPVEQVEAGFISPSTLSLGDDGELGVKAVDQDNRVYFLPIKLVKTSMDGAWVSGIPANTRIITLGQGFVSTGELVEPKLPPSEGLTATAGQN